MDIAVFINTANAVTTIVALLSIMWWIMRTAYNPNAATLQTEIGRGLALQLVETAKHSEQENRLEDAAQLYEAAARIYAAASDWSAQEATALHLARTYYEQGMAAVADQSLDEAGELFTKSMRAAAQAGDKDSEILALQQMMSIAPTAAVSRWLEENKDIAAQFDEILQILGMPGDWRTRMEHDARINMEAMLAQYTRDIRRRRTPKQMRILFPIVLALAVISSALEIWAYFYVSHPPK